MAPNEVVQLKDQKSATKDERVLTSQADASTNDLEEEEDNFEDAEEGVEEAATVDDEEGPAIALPDSGEATEGGKLKMIVSLLKKCLGVKDLASMYVL